MKVDLRDRHAGIMLVATVVAVVGAFLIFRIQPWGMYAAAGLMLAWAILAFVLSYLERDSTPLPPQPPMHPALRVVALLLGAAGLGVLAYAWSLDRRGAPGDVVSNWQAGAMLLFFLGNIGMGALDWLRRRLLRRPA